MDFSFVYPERARSLTLVEPPHTGSSRKGEGDAHQAEVSGSSTPSPTRTSPMTIWQPFSATWTCREPCRDPRASQLAKLASPQDGSVVEIGGRRLGAEIDRRAIEGRLPGVARARERPPPSGASGCSRSSTNNCWTPRWSRSKAVTARSRRVSTSSWVSKPTCNSVTACCSLRPMVRSGPQSSLRIGWPPS